MGELCRGCFRISKLVALCTQYITCQGNRALLRSPNPVVFSRQLATFFIRSPNCVQLGLCPTMYMHTSVNYYLKFFIRLLELYRLHIK
uniref:Uncharacterized protein n=2 Tax=Anguilla anguilla TaxID=7936 RepID=A0A0E9UB77_ANGAN